MSEESLLFPIELGRSASFTKTIAESDVYLFAGITGDLSPNHVDEETMKATPYGTRIAHGALLIGFMSNTSSKILEGTCQGNETAVSLGYDRIRFLAPARIGDTISVHYEIVAIDPVRRRSTADCRITNQRGEVVAVAQHILKWVANNASNLVPPTGS